MRLQMTRCHPFYAAIHLINCLCCMSLQVLCMTARHDCMTVQRRVRAAHWPTEECKQHCMVLQGLKGSACTRSSSNTPIFQGRYWSIKPTARGDRPASGTARPQQAPHRGASPYKHCCVT